jgi:hypothetical protein
VLLTACFPDHTQHNHHHNLLRVEGHGSVTARQTKNISYNIRILTLQYTSRNKTS